MDEPGCSWPAWKFGMKREDLYSKLHDQYNTITSSIQDPEAFHHDVCEISHAASNPDEFHRLLADRKEQRLRELNESLESASVEIIANPALMGTHQWQYALQLFRTKSLDSLVSYFSSYLPVDHPWRPSTDADGHSEDGDAQTSLSTDSAVDVVDLFPSKPFLDDYDEDFLTDEPLTLSTTIPASHLPPSPRSLTMYSNSSAASPIDLSHGDYGLHSWTSTRTPSFSESDPDVLFQSGTLSHGEEDMETSQPDDSSASSVSMEWETRFRPDSVVGSEEHGKPRNGPIAPAEREGQVAESTESDTPTPRNEPEASSDSYMSLRRSKSSISLGATSPLYTHVLQEYARSPRKSRREGSRSPPRYARKTSPEIGRVQKPKSDPVRTRPKDRRHD